VTTPFRKKGFALVITLMLIVLVAVFITATLSTVGTDTQATDANASAENAKRLADIAVQTVISQLQEATTQGSTIAWASQPGMIRCYDNQGKEKTWYKLYSAEQMIQTAPASSGLSQLTADLPTGTWEGVGVFTDLNSPVLSADGKTNLYPIMDPIGAKFSNNTNKTIAGFDIDQTARPSGSNTAPMPVRWLYVLRDGTLVPADGGASIGSVKVVGAGKSNPIIGRIAFWADDDTSKININTAGDGTYFDSPRFNSTAPVSNPNEVQRLSDRQFAVTPPVAKEFQRYIGHPAQTRLSTVIPGIAKLSTPLDRSKATTDVTPFLQWGGSQGGSISLWDADLLQKLKNNDPAILSEPKRTTLYASLDEWIFDQQRTPNTYPDETGSRQKLVTSEDLNRLRFLLTTSSEAPEINLFGKPRIAMWPLHDSFLTNPLTPWTTRFDRMIASVATLSAQSSSPQTYFFTRADSTSPTYDYASIPRNRELFGYLRRLSGENIPGFGNSFASKYGRSGADQILTEIFDYIRSTNVSDPMLMPPTFNKLNDASSDYTYSRFQSLSRVGNFANEAPQQLGRGQVTPIYIQDYGTKGFGRFYTISELALNLAWAEPIYQSPPNDTTKVDLTQWKIAPVIDLGLFSPSLGPPTLNPSFRIEIEGLEKLKITTPSGGVQQLFSGKSVYSSRPKASDWNNGNWFPFFWGGAAGPRPLYVGKGSNYAFYGTTFTVKQGDTVSFNGGDLTVRIYWDNQYSGPTTNPTVEGFKGKNEFLVQTINIKLPDYKDLPAPSNHTAPSINNDSNKAIEKYPAAQYLATRIDSGFYGPTNSNRKSVSQDSTTVSDTIRSVVGSYNGDLRLIAAQRELPTSAFEPHQNYSKTDQAAHSLREPFPDGWFRAGEGFTATGQLVDTTYSNQCLPITGRVTDVNQPDTTGDWDNGLSIMPDGPYINKPDEVALQYYTTSSLANGTYSYYMQGDEEIFKDTAFARGYSSPNRTVASPVMFGSLSTGVPVGNSTAVPWRTLLFRPQKNHFGQMTEPNDYLVLDWFWMPVVEPYAISTTFATAGKVNMNYQIAPFTYITRATALISTLGSEYVIAVPTSAATGKNNNPANPPPYKDRTAATTALNYRSQIKVVESDGLTAGQTTGTLRQFKELFDKGEIFRSAAQICGIYLVPDNQSWTSDSQAESFWSNNKLTGDNTRERPYNGLYSRLTTKSNTYTVHVRVQVLKPDPNGPEGIWTENAKRIASEYRGSYTVNRYLDREQDMPDFASAANFDKSIEGYYRYRILDTRAFQP